MLDKIQKKQRTVVLAIISNTYRSIQMTTNSNIGISIYTKKHLFFTCSEYCIANANNMYTEYRKWLFISFPNLENKIKLIITHDYMPGQSGWSGWSDQLLIKIENFKSNPKIYAILMWQ